MRFAFDEDQLAFAEALREVLSKECGPDVVRRASDGGSSADLWHRLSDMGVVGLLAPEGVGGLGLAEIDLVLLLVEAGRAAAPVPLSDVAAVAIPAIRDHGQSDDAESLLVDLCSGARTVAVGLALDGGIVEGAAGAAAFLLEAEDGLHLVDPDVVSLESVTSVDGARHLSRVTWTPSPATRLSNAVVGARQAADRSALAVAAELCGLSHTMLGMTVGYVSERRQFGVPVGSNQALKHRLADALLALEMAQPLVWRAAATLSTGDVDSSVHVSMAKAQASVAAGIVSEAALQCHGAIGYTVEYDLHLFLKRAWALQRRAGDAAHHRRLVQRSLLG